jgi:hypothetical protein
MPSAPIHIMWQTLRGEWPDHLNIPAHPPKTASGTDWDLWLSHAVKTVYHWNRDTAQGPSTPDRRDRLCQHGAVSDVALSAILSEEHAVTAGSVLTALAAEGRLRPVLLAARNPTVHKSRLIAAWVDRQFHEPSPAHSAHKVTLTTGISAYLPPFPLTARHVHDIAEEAGWSALAAGWATAVLLTSPTMNDGGDLPAQAVDSAALHATQANARREAHACYDRITEVTNVSWAAEACAAVVADPHGPVKCPSAVPSHTISHLERGTVMARRAAAAHPATTPAVLARLADDPDLTVRTTVTHRLLDSVG